MTDRGNMGMNTEPVQHEPENLFRRNAIAPPAHRRGHTVTLRRALLTVGALLCVAISACGKLTEVPTYPPVSQYTWLPQNWSQGQRDWYHHADQGTSLGVPLEWFLALEQPSYSLTQAAPLSDPNYMDRFGFISYGNPPGAPPVPVGFAAGRTPLKADGSAWLNPATGKSMTGMGLTCAACHTGRMTWRGTEILIDGAPALTNVMTFRTVLGESLWFTLNWPFRFDRFPNRVLGPGAGDQAKAALRADLGLAVKQVEQEGKLEDSVRSQGTTEGFARLDALNRIGNTVFALDQKKLENYVGTSAPVHYPHIWNASWFTWVQYNGSIEQPMVRNAGEALGVGAFRVRRSRR
jgi:hypothetical protein